jgi:hypothetical protein
MPLTKFTVMGIFSIIIFLLSSLSHAYVFGEEGFGWKTARFVDEIKVHSGSQLFVYTDNGIWTQACSKAGYKTNFVVMDRSFTLDWEMATEMLLVAYITREPIKFSITGCTEAGEAKVSQVWLETFRG